MLAMTGLAQVLVKLAMIFLGDQTQRMVGIARYTDSCFKYFPSAIKYLNFANNGQIES